MSFLCHSAVLMLIAKCAGVSDGDFTLSAVPLVSITNGPTVVKCELRFSGARPVKILWERMVPNLQLRLIGHPFAEVKLVTFAGSIETPEFVISPGAALVEYHCIHQWGVKLNSNGEEAVIECKIRAPTSRWGQTTTIAALKKSMTIKPASNADDSIRAFSDNYLKLIRYPRSPSTQWCNPTEWLDEVKNPKYLSLMINVLAVAESSDDDARGLQRISKLECSSSDLSRRLAMEMTLRGLLCAQIFRLWDSRQLPLPEIRIREEILRAENPWTRALASLTFPKTPGTRNVKQIALDLRSGYLDRRGAEVHALVNQFGDSSYRTRERATRNLVALGEYADVPIRMALSRASDTEQRERLLAALKEIDSDPCPDSLRAIRAIEALGSPEALALLQMLAKESSDFRYSTSASLAANRLKKKQR